MCIRDSRWIQRSVRIKQLQEFLKSDHWLRRYCRLPGGVFYFEPLCTSSCAGTIVVANVQSENLKKKFESAPPTNKKFKRLKTVNNSTRFLAICRPIGCSMVSVVVVVVSVCNRSQMRTSKYTCLIFGVSIGLDSG